MISTRRNAALSIVSLLRPWQNWADLARASLGTLVLTELAFRPDPTKNAGAKPVLFQAGFLAVALLFQVMRVDRRASRSEQKLQLLAPIFYLCGITLVLSGISGIFAACVGWVFAISARNPAYQLPAMGAAVIAGGFVFGLGLALMSNVALILVPFFEAFVFRKRLVFVGAGPRLSTPVLKTT
ncbi:MAG: hypothetical protein L0Z50_21050 [Verrucomicrobiales bacterium]|nr:hypothetical protein [Verrucomicrobiales bacterium]